jgi:uncharacterized membrane protein YoaK (UPF0700 family)
MRRIPRFLAYVAQRYLRIFFKKSMDPLTYYTMVDRTMEQLPTRWEHWTREGDARTPAMNRQLAWSMAFVAGAVNAGGFLAVQHYTSHMTGVLSTMADSLALKDFEVLLYSFGMLMCFIAGAFVSTTLISYGKRHHWRGRYALAMVLEALLLLLFGYAGSRLEAREYFYTDAAVALLCFIMGLHNAVTTNISGAAVRTTHMTGTVTDIGIELSKLLYRNISQLPAASRIMADRARLRLLLLLAASFFLGGVTGALGFRRLGFKVTVPLAIFLLVLAFRPLALELRIFLRHLRRELRKME